MKFEIIARESLVSNTKNLGHHGAHCWPTHVELMENGKLPKVPSQVLGAPARKEVFLNCFKEWGFGNGNGTMEIPRVTWVSQDMPSANAWKAEAAIAEVKTDHRFKPKKSCKYMCSTQEINTNFDHTRCTTPQHQTLFVEEHVLEERGRPLARFPNRRNVYAALHVTYALVCGVQVFIDFDSISGWLKEAMTIKT